MYLRGVEGAVGQAAPPTGASITLVCSKDALLILDGFEVGDYRLRPHHYTPINTALPALKAAGVLLIEGHTDNTGSEVMNTGLSLNRASEVARFLTSSGVSSTMVTVGRGETSPRATNATPEGRRKNRRVEIRVCVVKRPPPPPIIV